MENNPKLNKLITLRKTKNLTTNDMAHILNISQSMYSYIEIGRERLSYDLSVKISDYFKITPDELFYDDYMKYYKK